MTALAILNLLAAIVYLIGACFFVAYIVWCWWDSARRARRHAALDEQRERELRERLDAIANRPPPPLRLLSPPSDQEH